MTSSRTRSVLGAVLLAVVAVALPLGLVSGWANSTIYDSARFSQRSVDILKSPAVQSELATKLTEQLALSGNQQAVNFRPAFELAVEAAVDTDTFRSIFRTAVRRTHEALLAGGGDGVALDLSDSVAIITSTLSLPSTAQPGQNAESSLGASLTDVTQRLADLGVWKLDETTDSLRWLGLAAALFAAVAAIALAADRPRVVRRLGIVIVADGLFIAAVVPAVQWSTDRRIDDPALASAVRGALGRGMGDLTSIGLWTAGYGIVVAAAATAMAADARRVTPARAAASVARWVERRRATTLGSVALGLLALLAGLLLIQDPWFWALVAVIGTGLWLAYFGLTELLGLVRSPASSPVATSAGVRRARRWRLGLVVGVVAVLVAVVSVGLVTSTKGAADEAEAAGEVVCNGDPAHCDRPLNLSLFAGSHNSMSSPLYPGWLFAEQVRTIGGQLEGGVRALLFDTHYGIESSARLPGSETPLILTDRAAELVSPTGEEVDPAIAARAEQLASRAPPKANAVRDIYLCHNYCELGAVPFSDVLGEIKAFVDVNPEDVVMIIIQDATTPADTAAAIDAAGLGDRAYTLDPAQPLPTLGEIIASGRTLLVFAEGGGPGAPAWYQPAYQTWFQETVFKFSAIEEMSCAPNRGPSDAPLFLVNHWVGASPPSPALAERVNAPDVVGERLRRCVEERGLVPNIVALDFALRGGAVAAVASFDEQLIGEFRQVRDAGRPASTASTASTTADDTTDTASADAPTVSLPPLNQVTPVTSLTGGSPTQFCAAVAPMLRAVSAWAVTSLAATPAIRGQPDLAFAPIADRTLEAASASAPAELVAQLSLARARAGAAVDALRGLGLGPEAIDALADLAETELSNPDNAGPAIIEDALREAIGAEVGDDRFVSAASAFAAANPEPEDLFDLGSVPDDVARAAGFDCLVDPTG